MAEDGFQQGDVAILNQDIERDGVIFPAGTECVVISGLQNGEYSVGVLEPRRETLSIPEAALDPVQP